jgi:hypothetical protein
VPGAVGNVCGADVTTFFLYHSGVRKSSKKQIVYILHIVVRLTNADKYEVSACCFYKLAVLKYVSRCKSLIFTPLASITAQT